MRHLLLSTLLVVALALSACDTGGKTGGLAGAGIGALAGNAIGGDTEATLIGAAVGAGIGYIIGNEQDKKQAKAMSAQSAANNYHHDQLGPLGGSRWLVQSVEPRDAVQPFATAVVEFRTNGRCVSTMTLADGRVKVDDESYRVVGDALIVNKPGYLINAQFDLNGDQLILVCSRFRAVMTRLHT